MYYKHCFVLFHELRYSLPACVLRRPKRSFQALGLYRQLIDWEMKRVQVASLTLKYDQT